MPTAAKVDTSKRVPMMTEEALYSSPILHPLVLFLCRVVFLTYFIIACYFTSTDERDNPIRIENTLSYMDMASIGGYFGAIVLFTIFRWKTALSLAGTRYDERENRSLTFGITNYRQWIPYLIYLAWDILCPCAFLVTLVYWGVIGSSIKFPSISMHIMNSVGMLFELVFNRILMRWQHVFVAILLGGAFLLHMWQYYENSGLFVYSNFDYTISNTNIIYWPASIVILVIIFFIVRAIINAKARKVDDFCDYEPVFAEPARYNTEVEMTNMA